MQDQCSLVFQVWSHFSFNQGFLYRHLWEAETPWGLCVSKTAKASEAKQADLAGTTAFIWLLSQNQNC